MNSSRKSPFRDSLMKRTQTSYEHREDTGQFGTIWKEPNLPIWKCGFSEHLLDFIPYIAGGHDPLTPTGEGTYLLDIWVHYDVGVNRDAFVCPARNYKLPCPICEFREILRKQEEVEEDVWKALNPKRRSIYNIICYDNEKEIDKGIQIFDVAHWFMEHHVSILAKTPTGRSGTIVGGYLPFADPVEGKSVSFEKKGTKDKQEFVGHKFVDRDYEIPEDILKMAYVLDDLIIVPTYDQLKTSFQATTPIEEKSPLEPPSGETQEPPKRTRPGFRQETSKDVKCPGGGTFGVDTEKLEQCGKCDIWDDCAAEADKRDIQAKKDTAPKEEPPKPGLRRGLRR